MYKYSLPTSLKLFVCTFLFTLPIISFGQIESDTTFLEADTVQEKVSLIPQKMGLIKRAFWGERGLMRITGISPLTPEARERELKVRRRMLVLHQIMGFVTLAGFLTADFSGQMMVNGHENYHGLHSVATSVTIGSYFTTAGLALLAPPPMVIRKKQWDNIRVHKLLAYLHFTGMVLTPLIAPELSGGDIKKEARFHQISAYTTTALFATAIIVIKF